MKEGWEIKKLGEVAEIVMGQSPSSDSYNSDKEGIPFFQGCSDFGVLNPQINYYCSSPNKIAFNKDLLISVRAPVGSLNISNCNCCIGRGLAAIRCNSNILNFKYLYHQLLKTRYLLENLATGAVFKAINKKILTDHKVVVPPISEQTRIVEELDLLNGILDKKRQQLKELDALSQSVFYDMFGDPIANEKGYPVFKIGDIIKFQGGSQPDKKYFEYTPTKDNIRLIQIRDYKTDEYKTYIPKSLAKRFCSANDIMIGRYGPPIFQILKGIEGSYNVALLKAIPNQGNIEFFRAFLKQRTLLGYLESRSKRTAGQDGIHMDSLKKFPLPLPPISLQTSFANKIQSIEHQKELIKASIAETQTLLDSRMDYYFN